MSVVISYSGGLDTKACLHWLKNERKVEHITCVLVDVGQQDDFPALAASARELGASAVVIKDMKSSLVRDDIYPMLRAGAKYEHRYLLGTAIARPIISRALAEEAMAAGAKSILHGATEKGNDYLRIEKYLKRSCPEIQVSSIWNAWEFQNREDLRALLAKANLKSEKKNNHTYSIDANVWHTSYEGGELEDLSQPVPEVLASAMLQNGEVSVSVGFENGLPVSLNGVALEPLALLTQLNALIESTGYGWMDIVESRSNGIKSRGIYHTPGGSVLYRAKEALDECLFPHDTLNWLAEISEAYGTLTYVGEHDHPMRKVYDAALTELYSGTQGEITLRIVGSQAMVMGRKANPMLFKPSLGGFARSQEWTSAHQAALVDIHQFKYHSRSFRPQKGE